MRDYSPRPGGRPVPEELRQLDLQTLIGQPLELARETVEALGGHFYVVDGPMLTNIDPRRVKVRVEDGRVISFWPGLS